MKVKVNKDACIGCGLCQAITNQFFVIGDDGFAEVNTSNEDLIGEVDKEKQDEVKDAIASCPTSAIEEV